MESHFYVCEYCSTAYKPKKRGTQKYCSTSCRVSAHKLRKKNNFLENERNKNGEEKQNMQAYEDTINAAGIGNALVGTAIVNIAQHFLIHPENRPATKGDIKELAKSLQVRYKPVLNMNVKPDGTRPYYDEQRQVVVYMATN